MIAYDVMQLLESERRPIDREITIPEAADILGVGRHNVDATIEHEASRPGKKKKKKRIIVRR